MIPSSWSKCLYEPDRNDRGRLEEHATINMPVDRRHAVLPCSKERLTPYWLNHPKNLLRRKEREHLISFLFPFVHTIHSGYMCH